jgi:hypothetical protein
MECPYGRRILKHKIKVMKQFIAKYQKAIVGTGAISVLLICYFQQKELAKLRAEKQVEVVVGGDIQKAEIIDSLNTEIFNLQTINGRYELSLEHLYEVNPSAGKQFTEFMENETE